MGGGEREGGESRKQKTGKGMKRMKRMKGMKGTGGLEEERIKRKGEEMEMESLLIFCVYFSTSATPYVSIRFRNTDGRRSEYWNENFPHL